MTMKRTVPLSLLTLALLVAAALTYTRSASSSPSKRNVAVARAVPATFNLLMPFATALDVDRADDTASASACTPSPNDCSLRGAIINANADVSGMPLPINQQPATTYNLTL